MVIFKGWPADRDYLVLGQGVDFEAALDDAFGLSKKEKSA